VVGVDVLVILDGASEPLAGARATSLEQASTPALDALAREGTLSRLRTVPAGLAPGSEVAIPTLLGWIPDGAVDRGAIEAAAHGIAVAPGERAWRVDAVTPDGDRAGDAATRRAARALQADARTHTVHRLTGHRLLVVGPAPLPAAARRGGLRAWPEGVLLPTVMERSTVMVAATGAAAGIGRLLGARVFTPAGATGGPASDLAAKAACAVRTIANGAIRVIVHVGGPDEAAHALDAEAKVAVIERADRDVVAPLAAAVRRAGGTLRVCPDHGCDPATGRHDAHPVPCVTWPGPGSDVAPAPRRLTERAVADLRVTDLTVRLVAA
jgi:2,3-bisphosphoglycerate-independent phosphoglycerate mutase